MSNLSTREWLEQKAAKRLGGIDGVGNLGRIVSSMTVKASSDVVKLNKTERSYLAYLRFLGDTWVGVQCVTLKLADDCRLTPDFAALNSSGEMRFIDVKGFQREDALIKMKVAARLFPWATFVIVKKDGESWNHQFVKS